MIRPNQVCIYILLSRWFQILLHILLVIPLIAQSTYRDEARKAYESKEFQRSADAYREILDANTGDKSTEEYYALLFEYSKPLIHLYKFSEAEAIYDNIIEHRSPDWDTLYAQAMNAKMVMHDFRGEYDDVLSKGLVSISIADIPPALKSDAHSFVGKVYLSKDILDSSLYHLSIASAIDQEIADSTSLPWSYYELGKFERQRGDLSKAIEYFLAGIKSTPIRDEYKTCEMYAAISELFVHLRNREKAKLYGEKGFNLAKKHKLMTTKARCLLQLSRIDLMEDRLSMALEQSDSSIAILRASKNKPTLERALLHAADVAIRMDNYKLASDYLEQVSEDDIARRGLSEQALYFRAKGKIFLRSGQDQKGIQLLEQSLGLAASVDDPVLNRQVHQDLYDYHRSYNDYDEALQHLKKIQSLDQAIFALDQQSQVLNLQEAYESTQKDHRIKLLAAENQLTSEALTKRTIGFFLLAAICLLLAGTTYFIINFNRQRRIIETLGYEQEIAKKKDVINSLSTRIYDNIHNQPAPIELHPFEVLNDWLPDPLSEKEYQVLQEVANGRTNKAISQALFISENTVKFHLKKIYTKLDVNNRKAAVSVASLNPKEG